MARWASLTLVIAGVFGGAAASAQQDAPRPTHKGVQLAQVCGWFAIYACSRGYADAAGVATRYRGYVIDTSDPTYPNFRGGWYCVVEGPTSRDQALALAAYARRDGHHTAYAKSNC
jgi:hypothetical protein